MKRIHQINDRRRALKLRKRSQFDIAMSRVVFCKSCFLVLRKGQPCPFCKLDVLPSLRPYQRAALDMIAKDLTLLPLTVRKRDLGKSVTFPRT